MGSLLRFWQQRRNEEISLWVGLSFGGLYLVSVIAIGIAAVHVQRMELTDQRLSDVKQWAYWLSRHLARAYSQDSEVINREIRAASREEGIAYVSIVSPKGIIKNHSDPKFVGRQLGPLEWIDTAPVRVRSANLPGKPEEMVISCKIISPVGKSIKDDLYIGLRTLRGSWKHSDIYFWSGYILLAGLGLYLLLYRLFRHSIQPLAVIRDRLTGCNEPMADRLDALRLNDSFDRISSSWNELIEFVSETQDQLRRKKVVTDVSLAMDGYRSEQLANILMQIPLGVMVIDADETISFANRAAVGMLGTSGESLEHTPASGVFEESLLLTLLSPAGNEGGGQSSASRWIDHGFKRPHGEVTLRLWSIPSSVGWKDHIIFIQDVSQTKEAERSRDRFLYHVTHELRTPLTNIRAYAETLSQGVIEDEQTIRECYNVIMSETQRLNRLVEDILNVSQLEVGSARLNIGEVLVDELLRKIVQDSQGNADAKNIELLLELPIKLPRVRGDKDRLAVVMTNLIGNAIKYTPENGQVDIRCSEEKGRVRVSVSDSGIGIAEEDQEKIFEKFYRVESEQVSKIPGTGLGLAIVKETVRLHGGSITVESTPGKGTTFSVVLPVLQLDESGSGPSSSGRIAASEES
ncbi:MAG: ATP-binding protein [Planctomycetota bacterium]|jgi:signal transduction histidine kinase